VQGNLATESALGPFQPDAKNIDQIVSNLRSGNGRVFYSKFKLDHSKSALFLAGSKHGKHDSLKMNGELNAKCSIFNKRYPFRLPVEPFGLCSREGVRPSRAPTVQSKPLHFAESDSKARIPGSSENHLALREFTYPIHLIFRPHFPIL
jgi:hypothetical protein